MHPHRARKSAPCRLYDCTRAQGVRQVHGKGECTTHTHGTAMANERKRHNSATSGPRAARSAANGRAQTGAGGDDHPAGALVSATRPAYWPSTSNVSLAEARLVSPVPETGYVPASTEGTEKLAVQSPLSSV